MRNCALKIAFALTLLLLTYNYATDMSSGISAYFSEGLVLDSAMHLAHGENIYRADIENPPYIINNYGPMYFLLQWPFLRWAGPTHLFGNLISVISHLASAWFAGLIVLRLTENKNARAITSLLVLAMPLVGGGLPLYRVDLLAQALSLAGVYVGISRKKNVLAALLFAAAIYTKMTYAVCGPASIFFFHMLQGNRKQAFAQAGILAAIGLVLLGVMQWLTTGGFFFNTVTANQVQYSLQRALQNWGTIYPQIFIASLAIPTLWQNKSLPPPARLFASLYLFFASCTAMASGKIGANYGYFSELQVALAMVLGVTASRFLWAQMLACFYFLFSSPYHHYLRTNLADIVALKETIQTEPGLVLADDYAGLVVLAGKPLYFSSDTMTQLYYKGEWSQDRFVQELREGKFSLILLGEYGLRKERWTPEMLTTIYEHYHLDKATKEVEIWRRN